VGHCGVFGCVDDEIWLAICVVSVMLKLGFFCTGFVAGRGCDDPPL
ncbi:hypothetical protein A2U01_0026942, partial [Trifolium medium]|nr:hypothetical protein [Trifolium medium]